MIQKLVKADIICSPETKPEQYAHYLLKNAACYVNIEEQIKYTPEATVQEMVYQKILV